MISFDGTPKTSCTPRRIRTNTPLQALVTLNDSAFLFIKQKTAYDIEKQPGDIRSKLAAAYEQALVRQPDEKILNSLQALYNKALTQYRNDPSAACELIGVMDEHD